MEGLLRGLLCTLVVLATSGVAAQEPGVTVTTCERNLERVADAGSCSRYHVCRGEGDNFITDIAVCAHDQVFDMVTQLCVMAENGYLQDPSGCTTFYGCHRLQNSEGLTRHLFSCPGNLRFHPEKKHCTYKTNVPDTMCNSNTPSQKIIGTVEEDNTPTTSTRPPSTTTTTTTTTTSTTTTPTTTTTKESTAAFNPDILVRVPQVSEANREHQDDQDLDRIVQVIKGQLLNRRHSSITTFDIPADAREGVDIPANAREGVDIPANAREGVDIPANAREGVDIPANAREGVEEIPSTSSQPDKTRR